MFSRPAPTPPDVLAVVSTSSLLAVSEFRVFELAYASWYGVESDEKEIERHFVPYMFREEVPCWVRAFTRRILGLEEAGRLDPREFGIEPRAGTLSDVATGLLCSLGIVVALAVLVTLAEVTAQRLGLGGFLFPPGF